MVPGRGRGYYFCDDADAAVEKRRREFEAASLSGADVFTLSCVPWVGVPLLLNCPFEEQEV